MARTPWPVIALPGSVLPVEPAYGALLAELGPALDAHPKELEVDGTDAPLPDFSLATEIAGISRGRGPGSNRPE